MSRLPGELSPAELGVRLRIARESAGVTQADAAELINVARTTLVAIEQGSRKAKFSELQKLAQHYRTSANALLREEAVHTDFVPQFRKHSDNVSDPEREAARLLSNLVQAEIELENILGVTRSRNYPEERPIGGGDVKAQAEKDSVELRKSLALGLGPIGDIVSLLQLEMGVRVYVRRLPKGVSGLFAYNDAVGACILLNSDHPRERRTLTAAHELAHLVATRREPDLMVEKNGRRSRGEIYAGMFASAFLMPGAGVLQKFKEITAGSDRLTRRHVILLAYHFDVSREALVRRLEELGVIKRGTWDWFSANGGITIEQARQVLGDLPPKDRHIHEAGLPTSLHLSLMAVEAWRRNLLSEGQLSKLLGIDRVQLRVLLEDVDSDEGEADDGPRLLS